MQAADETHDTRSDETRSEPIRSDQTTTTLTHFSKQRLAPTPSPRGAQVIRVQHAGEGNGTATGDADGVSETKTSLLQIEVQGIGEAPGSTCTTLEDPDFERGQAGTAVTVKSPGSGQEAGTVSSPGSGVSPLLAGSPAHMMFPFSSPSNLDRFSSTRRDSLWSDVSDTETVMSSLP